MKQEKVFLTSLRCGKISPGRSGAIGRFINWATKKENVAGVRFVFFSFPRSVGPKLLGRRTMMGDDSVHELSDAARVMIKEKLGSTTVKRSWEWRGGAPAAKLT